MIQYSTKKERAKQHVRNLGVDRCGRRFGRFSSTEHSRHWGSVAEASNMQAAFFGRPSAEFQLLPASRSLGQQPRIWDTASPFRIHVCLSPP